jgi:superfamily I DNA/RNA helicase
VMQSGTPAYLVLGTEPFLKNFSLRMQPKVARPIPVSEIKFRVSGRRFEFFYNVYDKEFVLDRTATIALVHSLGRFGAYTHEFGRYWCIKALTAERELLKAFSHRYPEILVDEAQDIGSAQQAILTLLADAGSSVTLIGDPHQAIFAFAGADGAYLSGYSTSPYRLTCNYRSIPSITAIAQFLSGERGKTHRDDPGPPAGAYAVPYREGEFESLLTSFRDAVAACGLDLDRSAVLCRAAELVNEISGGANDIGIGAVKILAKAAILRDVKRDFHRAFRLVAVALEQSLLDRPPAGLAGMLADPRRYPEYRVVRRLLWNFVRANTGLPSANLQADTDWHEALRHAVEILLNQLALVSELKPAPNIGSRLSAKSLPSTPVSRIKDDSMGKIRVDTVHRAKGETLDAVLYVTTKLHLDGMLAGTTTELGRIGYVAVTRPRDLLWVAVPAAIFEPSRAALEAAGFRCFEPSG